MLKKLILIVLIVLLVGFISPVFSQEEDNTKVIFIYKLASENTIYGIVFPLGNYLFNSLDYGLTFNLFEGEASAFLQTAVSKSSFTSNLGLIGPTNDFFDTKCYLGKGIVEYVFITKSLKLKTIAHFLSWQFPEKDARKENSDLGILVGEEITVRTFLNPTFGYLHFWADKNNEFTGDYFFIKIKKELMGINWEARIGYNKGFLVDGRGMSNMFSGSKKINLGKDFFVKLFLRFLQKDSDVDENQIIGGVSLQKAF